MKGNTRNAKMLQRHINLHFSCQKCLNKWGVEDGLVKLYFNPIWRAKNFVVLYKTVVIGKKCPKCKEETRANSVFMKDVKKLADEFGLDIVRKISCTLNKLADDSS